MTETTHSEETADEGEMRLALEQRPSNVVTQQLFGLDPYVIIRPELDGNDIVFNIEVGGGATLDTVGEVFEGLADAFNEPHVATEIRERMEAAERAAEEEDDGDE